MADDISSGLDIGWNCGCPGTVRGIKKFGSTPNPVAIKILLADLEEFELVDVDLGDGPIVRRHKGRDGTLVAVEPTRPMKGNVTSGTNLSNGSRCWAMHLVASHSFAIDVEDWSGLTAAIGNASWGRAGVGVEKDIPAGIAVKSSVSLKPENARFLLLLHGVIRRHAVDIAMAKGLASKGEEEGGLNRPHLGTRNNAVERLANEAELGSVFAWFKEDERSQLCG